MKGPPTKQTIVEAYNIVQWRLRISGETETNVGHMMHVYAKECKDGLGADGETALKLAGAIDAELRAKAVEATKDWTS